MKKYFRNLMVVGTLVDLSVACTALPFVENAPDTSGTLAICYEPQDTTRDEVLALAQEECTLFAEGTAPKFMSETRMECSLMQPNKVTFQCVGTGGMTVNPGTPGSTAAPARPIKFPTLN